MTRTYARRTHSVVACGRPGAQVCERCRIGLRRIGPPLCARCGAPTSWPVRRCRECSGRRLAFAHARAAVEYDEPVRRIVAAWKERGLRRIADWAALVVAEMLSEPNVECIVPVPHDPERRLKRGHHPAANLARALGVLWDLPTAQLLERPRRSTPQRGLDDAARRRNVAGAFRARACPRRVLLVDDVYTTGATAHSAASALRKAGGLYVEVATLARTIRIR